MFGGGVVALPLFQQELVQTTHWLTPQQFLDGVAIGQLTPGPITVVATFAGYAVAGFPGAIVATVAMYLPSFALMLGATPLLMRLRHSSVVQRMLQGIMAGALGMMGATAVLLGRAAITNLWQGCLGACLQGVAELHLRKVPSVNSLSCRDHVHPCFTKLQRKPFQIQTAECGLYSLRSM